MKEMKKMRRKEEQKKEDKKKEKRAQRERRGKEQGIKGGKQKGRKRNKEKKKKQKTRKRKKGEEKGEKGKESERKKGKKENKKKERKQQTVGWLEVIESDIFHNPGRNHRNRKECCRDATTSAKDAKVQKTGPSYAHSMTVVVQLCLKLCVAEVSRNRRKCEGYSGAVH